MNKTLIDWFAPLDPQDTAKEVGTVGTVGTASPRPQKTADEEAPNLFPPKKEAVGTVGTARRSCDAVTTVTTEGSAGGYTNEALESAENCGSQEPVTTVTTVTTGYASQADGAEDPVPTVPTGGFLGGNRNEPSKPAENCASQSPVPTVPTVPTQNDSETADPDDLEERVAIIAEGSGCPIEWAEGLARLDPNRPPGDVPPAHWIAFCDTAGVFVDRWAARADELGWSTSQVFGCDRHAPFARLDRQGLVWSLVGCTLVELTETEATIETVTGSRLKFPKRPVDREPARAALAWDPL